jgi:PilZ domain
MSDQNDVFGAIQQRLAAMSGAEAETTHTDRRTAVRFPIEEDVRYKVFNRNTIEIGLGKTLNMSSSGILFTTERTLVPGERLEVAVNWPAQLDHKCALKLVTTGRVVRSDTGLAAIAIERYEFRTQGIRGLV